MLNAIFPAGGRSHSRRPRPFGPAWLLLAVLLLMPAPARAYVDPGAGTMIWQMLVAGFLGAVFYLRRLIPSWRPKKKAADPPES